MEEEINIVPVAQAASQFLMVNEKDAGNYAAANAVLVDLKNKTFTKGIASALRGAHNLSDVKKEQIPQIFTLLFQTFSEQEVNDSLLKVLKK